MKSKSQIASQLLSRFRHPLYINLIFSLVCINIAVLILPIAPVAASSATSRAMVLGDDIGYVGKVNEGIYSVAWGDWDNDGDLDLATGTTKSTERDRVYENINGSLVCDPVNGYGWEATIAYYTMSVAWSDFDGDGDLDLTLGNNSSPILIYENEAGMLQLDTGNQLGWQAPVSQSTRSIAWGDWDGDGDPDLALGNIGVASRVYENLGDGTLDFNLTPGVDHGWEALTPHSTYKVTWVDYDNDNDLDLALANKVSVVEVYENGGGSLTLNPAGGFGWATSVSMNTTDIAWGDYNDDGYLDLAVANTTEPANPELQYLQVFQNNQNGTLSLSWQSTTEMVSTAVAWADWDNDGDLDLAVGNKLQPNRVYENSAGVLQYNPAGLLGWQSTGSISTNQIAWADWDSDGDLDLTAGGSDLSLIYANHSSNLVDGWTDPTSQHTQSIAWGD